MNEAAASRFIHATALVFGEDGVVIQGASGSGKSSLAAALLGLAAATGRFARLVGDDRLGLCMEHGRLLAWPHPAVAGLIERRGIGLMGVDHEPACVLTFAVRLAEEGSLAPRLPQRPQTVVLCDATLPLLVLPAEAGAVDNAARVAEALAAQRSAP